MIRRLLAVGAALVLTTALALDPVSASTSTTGPAADAHLLPLSRAELPFIEFEDPILTQNKTEWPAVRDLSPFKRVGKLDGTLAGQLADAKRTDRFAVLVTTAASPSNLTNLPAGVVMDRVFSSAITGFAAELTADQIAGLEALPQVQFIEPDRTVKALVDNATRWTGATKVRTDFGLTGDGDGYVRQYSAVDAVIAIVDTGIDAGHKDLAGKVIGWVDLVNGEEEPYDDNGHGTHVAGIAAGSGTANPRMKGVAPGAALVGVKVLDADGWGAFSSVIEGIEWVIDHADEYNIRVMNISLGSSDPSDGEDALSQAVNSAALSGILVTVASGNTGADLYTIGSPAAADGAVTVASMRDVGEGGWSLSDFSGRGPTLDGRVKPDIAAPGYRITAPLANTTSRYITYTGSSMASPFVAGTAALLLEANPTLSADAIKQILYTTAEDWGEPGQDIDYGYGRLDVYKAVAAAMKLKGRPMVGPVHDGDASFMEEGGEAWYELEVTDPMYPVAVTLVLPGTDEAYYDLDLYLYDAAGTELADSQTVGRQENIHFRPTKKGFYYLRVAAYEGSGPYAVDVSWR
ncbi:MAG: S8 family serine peptidase [Mycobacterium leprae]